MYEGFKNRLRIFEKFVFIFVFVLLLISFLTAEYTIADCLSSGSRSQQHKKRPLTIEDYYHAKSISNVSISPNGRWVVYTIRYPVERDNSNMGEIWYISTDGKSEPKRITGPHQNAERPRWTDDGVLSYRIGRETWYLNIEEPGARPFKDVSLDRVGSLSPDKKWEADVRPVKPSAKKAKYSSDFERRHEERFKGAQFDWLRFQRDGRTVPLPDPRDEVANPKREIFLKPADSGEWKQLTDLGFQAGSVSWRPDGKGLVFAANPEYRNEMSYGRTDLWEVTLDGKITRLTDDEYNNTRPVYSPDGKYIVFSKRFSSDIIINQKLDHGGPVDLYIMSPDGSGVKNLTADWDFDPGRPYWSPDSKYIYFQTGIGGSTPLCRVSVEESKVEQVTKGERRLGSMSFDREMIKMAYTVGKFESPREIYVADIDGSHERQLTHVYDDIKSEIAISPAERLLYKSYDGTEIEGWLLYPYDYDPDTGPYPMIVHSHGGPHSASGYGFNFKHQLFAAQGYFVLQTNFRGSIGYGDDFKWAIWGQWGTLDGQDVMAGIDYVIENFPVDRDRIGHTGHSYGGFMTNWLITQYPDRLAAAVAGASISNWLSDYGTADVAVTKETEFFGNPWTKESRDRLLKQSPLIYAGNAKTPTLFVHGELDNRVPYEEGEQMYFALRRNGVPAKMIKYFEVYHGGWGHWNNVHRMIHELKWFNKYLK